MDSRSFLGRTRCVPENRLDYDPCSWLSKPRARTPGAGDRRVLEHGDAGAIPPTHVASGVVDPPPASTGLGREPSPPAPASSRLPVDPGRGHLVQPSMHALLRLGGPGTGPARADGARGGSRARGR